MGLTGKDLLAKAKELSAAGASKTAQAEACGYVRTVQKGESVGKPVTDTHAFLSALAEANGFVFAASGRGFKANGTLKVNTNGQVTIGPSYLRKLGIEPGARVAVEAVEDAEELVLSPIK